MKAALDLARDAENEVSLPTDPIALLRSPLRTQLSLIKELYVDENEA